jgi:hypothetical protein
VELKDPSGRIWSVERELVRRPRWRGFKTAGLGWLENLDPLSGASDGWEGILIGVAIFLAIVLLIVAVWPLLILVAELVIALLVVGVRLVLGRWTVVAETPGGRYEWHVRGRSKSKAFAATVVSAVRHGHELPAGASFESIPRAHLTEADVAASIRARPGSGGEGTGLP